VANYTLVSPMAGRGSRFAREGFDLPKPLIDLAGRPYFWWATESVRRVAPVGEMVFVVLQEHVASFGIDARIKEFYPDAKVVAIGDVTSGAAETARIGMDAVEGSGPVAVNDCDHAFICPALGHVLDELAGDAAGGLMCFRSSDPAYSYVQFGPGGEVTGTVEKQVVSPLAIAGCYLFANRDVFDAAYRTYGEECPYDELFVSGLYNLMATRGERLVVVEAAQHCSFGTPAERARITDETFRPFAGWR
jgi:dTDP-glucose pyrophosphorylase